MKKFLILTGVLLLAGCTSAQKEPDATGAMQHDMGSNGDSMNMTMTDMMTMLDGKTGDDFDKAFLEGMIPHHQGAIGMANKVLVDAKHPELQEMARAIIESQQKEIDQMMQWQREWGYTE